MKTFCKHHPHRTITDIMSPKWSTREVLIATHKIRDGIDDYLIQFSDPSPQKEFGWFLLKRKDITASKTQLNGKGTVYCVPLSKREEFTPLNKCDHLIK